MWSADLTGGLALVFGAEGKGVRPLVRRACDAAVSIPLAGQRRVAQRQRRRRAAPLRGTAEARRWLSRRSISSTATTCCTRARSTTSASCTDALASFVAMRGARGAWSSGTASEPTRRSAPLSVRYAPQADAVLERLAAEHRDTRGGLSRLVGLRRARHVRPGGAEAIVPDVPRRPRARRAMPEPHGSRLGDSLDDETRERLERLRRGDELRYEHTFLAELVHCKPLVTCAALLLSSASTSG